MDIENIENINKKNEAFLLTFAKVSSLSIDLKVR